MLREPENIDNSKKNQTPKRGFMGIQRLLLLLLAGWLFLAKIAPLNVGFFSCRKARWDFAPSGRGPHHPESPVGTQEGRGGDGKEGCLCGKDRIQRDGWGKTRYPETSVIKTNPLNNTSRQLRLETAEKKRKKKKKSWSGL